MKQYCITASVTRVKNLRSGGSRSATKHLPTFYLDPRVQGITSENHAKNIADNILNPFADKKMKIDITAILVDSSEAVPPAEEKPAEPS